MNILIIDNSIAFTGAIKCALNEAELLSDHKFVFVIPSKSSLKSLFTEKKVKFYTLPMVEIRKSVISIIIYLPILFVNTIKLHKILKHENIEVIQVNDFYNLLGVMSKWLGFKGKLITYVRFLPSVMPYLLRTNWIRFAQKNSQRVIAVSEAVLKQLPAKKNTIRIYDPVNLAEKLPAKSYNATNNEVKILYLSNYIRGKGHDDAIEFFNRYYAVNKNLRMKFVGGDMDLKQNKKYKESLKSIVLEYKLNNVITFAGFNPDVEKEIKDADIVLNLSKAESFSMTCLEAAFYGTAVASSRCGGPEEIIADRQTGILISADNANDKNDFATLLSDVELRKTYAEAGKKYVRKKFSVDSFKKQFEEILASND